MSNAPAPLWKANHAPRESNVLWYWGVLPYIVTTIVISFFAVFDQTLIADSPRWLKPLKFSISLLVFNATFEWGYRQLQNVKLARAKNVFRHIITWGMLVEFFIIILQTLRLERSHFNTSSALDGTLYGIMGVVIGVLVTACLFSSYLFLKGKVFKGETFRWAFLWGIPLMAIAGFQGFSMTYATPGQELLVEQTGFSPVTGSHFIGEHSGSVVPLLGWSLTVGDMRIPHFVGLHAIQILLAYAALLQWLKVPTDSGSARRGLHILAVSLFALFCFVFWDMGFARSILILGEGRLGIFSILAVTFFVNFVSTLKQRSRS